MIKVMKSLKSQFDFPFVDLEERFQFHFIKLTVCNVLLHYLQTVNLLTNIDKVCVIHRSRGVKVCLSPSFE